MILEGNSFRYKVNHTESLHKRYDLYHATIEIRKGRIGKKNAETEYITISIVYSAKKEYMIRIITPWYRSILMLPSLCNCGIRCF